MLQLFRAAVLLFPLTAAPQNGTTFLTSLVEDPEPSDSVEASQGSGFLGSHQSRRYARFQFEHASMVYPLEGRKKPATANSFFIESDTAVKINQVRITVVGDKNVSLVSQIQMDDPSEMNLMKDAFQL